MRSFDTPVAIVLFNRPDRVAELVEALRPSKPRRIFAIADGPRGGHDTDRDRCALAREMLDSIDWPCEIVREYSSSNLGCDERIERGLD
ncbi:MAG: glycosyltransferase family 2 protein, partial [Phycisphaerales bacterium]